MQVHSDEWSEKVATALLRTQIRNAIQVVATLSLKKKLTRKDIEALRRARKDARFARLLCM